MAGVTNLSQNQSPPGLDGRLEGELANILRALERLAAGDLSPRLDSEPASGEGILVSLYQAVAKLGASMNEAVSAAREERAEHLARENEALLRLVIDANPSSIAVKDGNGRYLLVNAALADRFELGPEQIIGKTGQQLAEMGKLSVEDLEIDEREDREVLRSRQLKTTPERRIRLPSGETRYLQTMRIPFSSDRSPDSVLEVCVDVTDRRRAADEKAALEDQLRQSQKMEAIGTLAGGIAHDFNNILGAIIGYTEVALLDVSDEASAASELSEVLKAANRARELVRRILAFSRQDEEGERKPLKLNDTVHEAVELLRASIPSTIEIESQIADQPCVAVASSTQVHQVVMNLCTNAAHAMRSTGGTLTVGVDRVPLDAEVARRHPDLSPGDHVRLRVADTGEGMSHKVRERIFDPFFTTKQRGEGTGLGLAVAHGIVRGHRGSIAVESEPSRGSTFEILIPAAVRQPRKKRLTRRTLPTGDETILFVDDEAPLARVGQRLLSRLGYNVIARTSSVEALEAFRARAQDIDLLITDQTMPNMTGLELAAQALKVKPDLPIVLATGYSEDFLRQAADALGICAIAMKPYLGRDLAFMVRRAIDRT